MQKKVNRVELLIGAAICGTLFGTCLSIWLSACKPFPGVI